MMIFLHNSSFDAKVAINRRMGHDAVFYGAAGVKRDWAMAATMKSQHFTTDRQQQMRVSAERPL
jgi:Domain of unknown function (DUF4113)